MASPNYVYNPATGVLIAGGSSINIGSNPRYVYDPNTQQILNQDGTPFLQNLTISNAPAPSVTNQAPTQTSTLEREPTPVQAQMIPPDFMRASWGST